MRYVTYLKERLGLVCYLLFWLFTINMFLMTFKGSTWLRIYINVSAVVSYFVVSYVTYYRKKRYFDEVNTLLQKLDKKYLLPEMISKGNNLEEKIFYSILKDMEKSMAEQVNSYKFSNREYKEYIEIWIHEVKIPIATAQLILANHKEEYAKSLGDEIKRIEDLTEQALFYARSSYVEKDYMITEVNLQDVVHQVFMRNKRNLIMKYATPNLHDLDRIVLSDSKWLGFVIGQIISNCMKYAGEQQLNIECFVTDEGGVTKLHIKDNGIGISKKDISMVFEKGYTGTNGRANVKSTGIGLYLCKKLCERLGHGIEIFSDGTSGCEVSITFARTEYYRQLINS